MKIMSTMLVVLALSLAACSGGYGLLDFKQDAEVVQADANAQVDAIQAEADRQRQEIVDTATAALEPWEAMLEGERERLALMIAEFEAKQAAGEITQEALDEAQRAAEAVSGTISDLESRVESIESGAAGALDRVVTRANTEIDRVQDHATAVLGSITDSIGEGGTFNPGPAAVTLLPLLPPGAQVPVLGILGLISAASTWYASKKKREAEETKVIASDIVASIGAMRSKSAVLRTEMGSTEVKEAGRSKLRPAASRFISDHKPN